MSIWITLAALVALSACGRPPSPQILTCTGSAVSSLDDSRAEETRRYRYSASVPSLSFWSAQDDRWTDGGQHEAELTPNAKGLEWRGYSLRANRVVRFENEFATVSDIESINEPTIVTTFTGGCMIGE